MFHALRPHLFTAFAAFLVAYFGFQVLTGPHGLLLAHQRLVDQAEKRDTLKRLQKERAELEARDHLMRQESLSADLVEERAHVLLEFADPRDYVVRAPNAVN